MTTLSTSRDAFRCTSANIPAAAMAELHNQDAFSFHAKVLFKKVGPAKLGSHFRLLLPKLGKSLQGTLQTYALENDFVLLKFSNSTDYNMALEGDPWLIDGHYIYLNPWVPNFKPSAAVITTIKVWIRLPELPSEYYHISVFQSIVAAGVGNLIKIHPVTENKLKLKYARLFVEIDLTRPLVSHVELFGEYLQPIEYEGIHVFCHACGRAGHLEHECAYGPNAPFLTQPNSLVFGNTAAESRNQIPVSNKASSTNVIPAKKREQGSIDRVKKGSDDQASSSRSSDSLPNPGPPLSANDKLFCDVTKITTKVKKLKEEILEIVEPKCPTVILVESKSSNLKISLNRNVNSNHNQIVVSPTTGTDYDNATAAALKIEPRTACFCRELGDPKVTYAAKELCKTHKPSIMVLSGARNYLGNDLRNLKEDLGFSSSYIYDSDEFTDNVLILWQRDRVVVQMVPDNTRPSSNLIFAAVKFIQH